MAPSSLGSVEVQKDSASRLWYSGHVTEVKSDTVVVVGFEDDVWPDAEYSVSSIRKPPRLSAAELEGFCPQIGEEVELRVSSTEQAPAGWGVAVVRNVKHGFYFVALVSAVEERVAIVEKDMLRPSTLSSGLPGGSLKQESYRLPKELESWISTADAVECFEHIEEQSGLIFIQTLKGGLRLIGDTKTIQRAKMLLQLHIKHQGKIQSFQETLERQLNALEKKRNRIEGTGYKHSVELQVDEKYVPRIIGKGGEAIRSLGDKYDVYIMVLSQEDDEGSLRTVRIFGNSMDNIEQAKAELDYVEEVMTVEPKMRSWILGQGGRTIQKFKESTHLLYARLELPGEQLKLMGTRQNVEDAKVMFETHFMYYNVFLQMDEEMEQILGELREYGETNARWEWGWNREEEEHPKGGEWKGKGGKGGKGGSKGSKGCSGKKGKEWEDWPARPAKGKSSKGGKGAGKFGDRQYREGDKGGKGAGKSNDRQYAEDGEQSTEGDNEDGHAYQETVQKGGGRGATGRTGASAAGARGGRAMHSAGGKQSMEEEDEASDTYEDTLQKGTGRGATGAPGITGAAGARDGRATHNAGRTQSMEEDDDEGSDAYEERLQKGSGRGAPGRSGAPGRTSASAAGGRGGRARHSPGGTQRMEEEDEDGDTYEEMLHRGTGKGAPSRTGATSGKGASAAGARGGHSAHSAGGTQSMEEDSEDDDGHQEALQKGAGRRGLPRTDAPGRIGASAAGARGGRAAPSAGGTAVGAAMDAREKEAGRAPTSRPTGKKGLKS